MFRLIYWIFIKIIITKCCSSLIANQVYRLPPTLWPVNLGLYPPSIAQKLCCMSITKKSLSQNWLVIVIQYSTKYIFSIITKCCNSDYQSSVLSAPHPLARKSGTISTKYCSEALLHVYQKEAIFMKFTWNCYATFYKICIFIKTKCCSSDCQSSVSSALTLWPVNLGLYPPSIAQKPCYVSITKRPLSQNLLEIAIQHSTHIIFLLKQSVAALIANQVYRLPSHPPACKSRIMKPSMA